MTEKRLLPRDLFPPVKNGLISRFIVGSSTIRADSLKSSEFLFHGKKKKKKNIVGSFYNDYSSRVYELLQFQSIFQPATAHRIADNKSDIPSAETLRLLLVSSVYNKFPVFFHRFFPRRLIDDPPLRFLNFWIDVTTGDDTIIYCEDDPTLTPFFLFYDNSSN